MPEVVYSGEQRVKLLIEFLEREFALNKDAAYLKTNSVMKLGDTRIKKIISSGDANRILNGVKQSVFKAEEEAIRKKTEEKLNKELEIFRNKMGRI